MAWIQRQVMNNIKEGVMTDNQKKTELDDEYQFPQDEYLSSEGETHAADAHEPEAAASVGATRVTRGSRLAQLIKNIPAIQNKRVLIVIIAVIAFIIMVSILNTSKKTVSHIAKPVVEQSSILSESDTGDTASLESLRTHNSRVDSKVRDLQAQLANLQTTVDQTKAENQQLTQSVTELSGQVRDLMTQLGEALARMGHTARRPGLVYHLRAILPDRAWISSSTGETRSVTIGDQINHYGVVRSIDPNSGTIITSSGRKITYGPNDY